MQFIREILQNYHREDNNLQTDNSASQDQTNDQLPQQDDGNDDQMASTELDNIANTVDDNVSQDPNKQGSIRTIPNAHLVYKRDNGDGGFEELWIYNIGSLTDELKVRKAILAGTDIPAGRTQSEDGSQQYKTWAAGNAELIQITGLPN